MINDIKQDAEQRMKKCIEALHNELAKLRTGRAHPSLLEHVRVDYYGSPVPLSQVANISVLDARTLSVAPWEKDMVAKVEKAILESDLGLNPAVSGTLMRIPLPALTEERRKDLVKVLRGESEKTRVAIRNVRRDANHHVKELLKDKDISEDDDRRAQDLIQKLTDQHVAEVDKILAQKETDLMQV
jgi:ribosome recycling factor